MALTSVLNSTFNLQLGYPTFAKDRYMGSVTIYLGNWDSQDLEQHQNFEFKKLKTALKGRNIDDRAIHQFMNAGLIIGLNLDINAVFRFVYRDRTKDTDNEFYSLIDDPSDSRCWVVEIVHKNHPIQAKADWNVTLASLKQPESLQVGINYNKDERVTTQVIL
jgi:hypothetical protein